MLLAKFIVDTSGAQPVADIRRLSKGREVPLYAGPLSGWTTAAADIRAGGKCVSCFYEGSAVMYMDRTQTEIVRDIASNTTILSEIDHEDRSVLRFVERSSLRDIRRTLQDSGAVLLTEHLTPEGRLVAEGSMARYFNEVCMPELSLRTGTVDERKMLTYRLSRLRTVLLPVLVVILALSVLGSLVTVKAAAEKQRLSSLVAGYSSALKHSGTATDLAAEAAARKEAHVPCPCTRVADRLACCRTEGVELSSVEMKGSSVTISGFYSDADALAEFLNNLRKEWLFASVEVAEVKSRTADGTTEFRMNAALTEETQNNNTGKEDRDR